VFDPDHQGGDGSVAASSSDIPGLVRTPRIDRIAEVVGQHPGLRVSELIPLVYGPGTISGGTKYAAFRRAKKHRRVRAIKMGGSVRLYPT